MNLGMSVPSKPTHRALCWPGGQATHELVVGRGYGTEMERYSQKQYGSGDAGAGVYAHSPEVRRDHIVRADRVLKNRRRTILRANNIRHVEATVIH